MVAQMIDSSGEQEMRAWGPGTRVKWTTQRWSPQIISPGGKVSHPMQHVGPNTTNRDCTEDPSLAKTEGTVGGGREDGIQKCLTFLHLFVQQ